MGGVGSERVLLENDRVRVTIDVRHGTEITEFLIRDRALDLVAPGPSGPRKPSRDPDLAFVDGYHGGWQEVFPNGGAPSTSEGVRFGQHDEVWRLEWTVEERTEIGAVLTVETRLLPFRLRKEVRLVPGAARLEVREATIATGDRPHHAMWGQHLAYGRPFLVPGARLTLPDGVEVRPHPEPINPPHRLVDPAPGRYPILRTPDGAPFDLRRLPEAGEPSDILYAGPFADPAWYEVARPDGCAVRVEWGARTLPYLWLWYELGATVGAPWYGTLFAIGCEPNSSWPTDGLAEAVRNGTALRLDPGQTIHSWHTVEVRP
ncbi:MAG: DUF4432 domain-containing protein [Candidatus Dormibacteraceae bacterium]